jgi:hypothetical protein
MTPLHKELIKVFHDARDNFPKKYEGRMSRELYAHEKVREYVFDKYAYTGSLSKLLEISELFTEST